MVVSKRKRWCYATDAKLGTCLAKIVLRLHPLPEDSGMSFIEQSGTPREKLAPVETQSTSLN